MSGSHPNFRDSGHAAPWPSQSTRQNTVDPGASSMTLSSSISQSTVYRVTPTSTAWRMSALFLTVLP